MKNKSVTKKKIKLPKVTFCCTACQQLELLVAAVPELYTGHSIAPGITLAKLPNGLFYGSIVIYNRDEEAKILRRPIHAYQAENLYEVIAALAEALVTKTEHVQKLRLNVRRSTKR